MLSIKQQFQIAPLRGPGQRHFISSVYNLATMPSSTAPLCFHVVKILSHLIVIFESGIAIVCPS